MANPVGFNPATGVGGIAMPSGGSMSISDLILMVGIQSMQVNDSKVQIAYQQIQKNNRIMKNLNDAMALANTNAATGGQNPETIMFQYVDPDTGKPVKTTLGTFLRANGITPNSGNLSKEQWQEVSTKLKNISDSMGGNNQIDMMKLQSTLNKLNEMSQMVSNNMSKLNQMMMSIIGNMR